MNELDLIRSLRPVTSDTATARNHARAALLQRIASRGGPRRRFVRRHRIGTTIVAIAVLVIAPTAALSDQMQHQIHELIHGEAPSAQSMHVFAEPAPMATQPASDVDAMNGSLTPIPPKVYESLRSAITGEPSSEPAYMRNGDLLPPNMGRVLLDTDTPGGHVAMYAIPTRKARVCFEAWEVVDGRDAGGGGCVIAFTDEQPVAPMGAGFGRGHSEMVYGLAADDVSSVTVVTDHGRQPATMGTNAFVWWPQEIGLDALRLDIELRDGQHRNYNLKMPPAASGLHPPIG